MATTTTSTRFVCAHCGDQANGLRQDKEGHHFCCDGCAQLFQLLHSHDLGQFYSIQEKGAIKPAEVDSKRFDHLNDPDIQAQFFSYQDNHIYQLSLRLPQIHCAACIYLLENLYRLQPEIQRSEVDFLKKEAHLTVKKSLSFKALVIFLSSLGYAPHLQHGLQGENPAKDEQKALLRRLAVAGFAFGNIMLLSFPEYLSPGGVQEPVLRSVIFTFNILLSLPLLFYSGRDYFERAWLGLRQRDLNIDIPIALGMLALFGRSVYEIVSGTGHGYLDSLAGLLFFLLIGRYFQQKTYDHLSFERDYRSFFPLGVSKVVAADQTQETPIAQLVPGDQILIRNQEIIPADAILSSERSLIDYSFVTGESAPQEKFRGDVLYAGGKVVGPLVQMEVIKPVAQGYLTRLWNAENFQKSSQDPFKGITDRISRYFTPAVLLLAFGGLIYWYPISTATAFQVFSAVLIIACPCALALSAPFTFGHAIRILGKNGLFVKNSAVIDKLSQLSLLVFDKTGTLTQTEHGEIDSSQIQWTTFQKRLVKTACQHSSHPLSRQLAAAITENAWPETDLFDEQAGKGIMAIVQGHQVQIGAAHWLGIVQESQNNGSAVWVKIDGEILGEVRFKNRYRPGIEKSLKDLKTHYQLQVLSGDNDRERAHLVTLLGSDTPIHFEQSPADKLAAIQRLKSGNKGLVMMVGDGLNDAGALRQADVGMAVSEQSGQFTPASDAILDGTQLPQLNNMLAFVRRSRQIIFSNLGLSLLYNLTGLSFALSGMLTPVVSAIFMPLSSITIVLNATLLSRYFARKENLKTWK
jgi:Cu+-exporting ATPase